MVTTILDIAFLPELEIAEPWEYFIKTNNDHGSTVYSLYQAKDNLQLEFVRVISKNEAELVLTFNNPKN